jgi:Protein of unknown function (DUF1761)
VDHLPWVNYWAVLVAGVVIFMLGGLWYSLLFAKPWIALMGLTEEQMKAGAGKSMPVMYLSVFVCGLISAYVLAVVINHFENMTILRGAMIGAGCWLGFAGATSYGTALFSLKPKELWLINSGYNLVSFVLAGMILAVWK